MEGKQSSKGEEDEDDAVAVATHKGNTYIEE